MQKLVEAEPEDMQDVPIDLAERTIREVLDEVVEAPLPAQGAGDDFRGKPAVALVGEVLPCLRERRWQVGAFAANRAQRVKRGDARRGCWLGRNSDDLVACWRVVECCERVVSEFAEDVVRAPAEFARDGETGAVVVEAFGDLEVVGVIGGGAASGALRGFKQGPAQKRWPLV